MAFDLTLQNSAGFVTGLFGQALSCVQAAGKFATVPAGALDRPSGEDWTAELWIKSSETPGFPYVFLGTRGDSDVYWFVGYTTGGLAILNLNGSEVDSAVAINDGTWHHLRVVYLTATTKLILYVDGVCAAVKTGTYALPANPKGAIGGFSDGGTSYGNVVTASVDEVAVFSSALATGTTVGTTYFTPPTGAYAGDEANLVALWHLDGDGTDSAGAVTTADVPHDDTSILYSPGNWAAGGTVNSGAYFRVLISDTSVATLNFDVSAGIHSRLAYRWDEGPLVAIDLAETVALTVPAARTQWRMLEVVVRAINGGIDRWDAPDVKLTSLTISAGATTQLPPARPRTALIFGDSIAEGYHAAGSTGSDLDDHDSTVGWGYLLGRALDAEVGVIAFAGNGVGTAIGADNVPPLRADATTHSYDSVYSGRSRDFASIAPDIVIYAYGQNDGGTTAGVVTTGLEAVIAAIRAASPDTRHLVLGDLGGVRDDEEQAAAEASGAAWYGGTTGILTSAEDSLDDLHPTATAHATKLVPAIAEAARDALAVVYFAA